MITALQLLVFHALSLIQLSMVLVQVVYLDITMIVALEFALNVQLSVHHAVLSVLTVQVVQ